MFLFLNWNLFLAFIPWVCTTLLYLRPRLQSKKVFLLGVLFLWTIFFPNAPYILTDLFHLRLRSSIPVWFDLILILSFAWTGLLYGLLSLRDIEKIVSQKLNKHIAKGLIISLLFLASFGVYLGRYLRWNSWDLLSNPTPLFLDIIDRFVDPLSHPQTWGVNILYQF